MDAIVQAAGTALVQAIATDAWQHVKQAVTGLWRRVRPAHADQVADELDKLRSQMLQARAAGTNSGVSQASGTCRKAPIDSTAVLACAGQGLAISFIVSWHCLSQNLPIRHLL